MIQEINGPNSKDWDREWYNKMAWEIVLHKPVEVYRNLHKDCWSVRQNGKVLFHTEYICLRDVKFVVQPAGREKVLREQKKNVHAFVKGYLISGKATNKLTEGIEWTEDGVTYNPYKHPHFMCGEFEATKAAVVDMDSRDENTIIAWSITIKALTIDHETT